MMNDEQKKDPSSLPFIIYHSSFIISSFWSESQLLELACVDRRRSVGHQVAGALVLREGDHVADVRRSRQHHRQTVQAQSDAAVRWSALAQRVQQEAEAPPRFVLAHAQHGEDTLLHPRVVDTDTPAADLATIE